MRGSTLTFIVALLCLPLVHAVVNAGSVAVDIEVYSEEKSDGSAPDWSITSFDPKPEVYASCWTRWRGLKQYYAPNPWRYTVESCHAEDITEFKGDITPDEGAKCWWDVTVWANGVVKSSSDNDRSGFGYKYPFRTSASMLVWGDVNADTSVHIDYQHQVPPKGQPKMPSGSYQDDKRVSISQTALGSKVFAGADGFATNAIEGDDPFVEIAIDSWVIYQRIWFVAWEQLPNQKAVLLREVFFGYSIP